MAVDSSTRSATSRTDVRVDLRTCSKNHGNNAVGNGLGTYLPGFEDEDGSSIMKGDDPFEMGVEDDPFEVEPTGVEAAEVELEADGRGGGSISEMRRGIEEAGV